MKELRFQEAVKQNFNMTIRLQLPEGWKLEDEPKSIRMSTEDKSLSGHILYDTKDERMLTIQVLFRQNKMTYYKETYDMLRQIYDMFSSRSKDMLVLKKI